MKNSYQLAGFEISKEYQPKMEKVISFCLKNKNEFQIRTEDTEISGWTLGKPKVNSYADKAEQDAKHKKVPATKFIFSNEKSEYSISIPKEMPRCSELLSELGFEQVEKVKVKFQTTLPAEVVRAMHKANKFKSRDKNNIRFSGFLLHGDGKQLRVAATDSVMLYAYSQKSKIKLPETLINIKLDSSTTGDRVLTIFDDGTVRIGNDLGAVVVTEEKFLDYRKLAPTYEHSFTLNRTDLLSLIKKTEVSANKRTKRVLLVIGKKLTMVGADVDEGTESISDMPVKTDLEKLSFVSFSAEKLRTVIKETDLTEVQIMTDGKCDTLKYIVQGNELYLVMPMQTETETIKAYVEPLEVEAIKNTEAEVVHNVEAQPKTVREARNPNRAAELVEKYTAWLTEIGATFKVHYSDTSIRIRWVLLSSQTKRGCRTIPASFSPASEGTETDRKAA